MALTENTKAYMLGFAMGLPLEQCKITVARWLSHSMVYFPPVPSLTMDQNEIAAFAVGVMIERIETE